jgi:hypothetical protein
MIYLLYILGVASRLIPHAANFAPIGAIGIFSAKKLGGKKTIVVLMAIMITSDVFLGFSRISPYVYAGFLTYILASYMIGKKIFSYILSPLAGGTMFFLISNFGVWLGPWYIHDFAGFSSCMISAIPFYRNTLVGDVVFTVALFSLYYFYEKINAKYFKEVRWVKQLARMNSRQRF